MFSRVTSLSRFKRLEVREGLVHGDHWLGDEGCWLSMAARKYCGGKREARGECVSGVFWVGLTPVVDWEFLCPRGVCSWRVLVFWVSRCLRVETISEDPSRVQRLMEEEGNLWRVILERAHRSIPSNRELSCGSRGKGREGPEVGNDWWFVGKGVVWVR